MTTMSMTELRRISDYAGWKDSERLRGDLIDLLANHELLDVLTREYLCQILEGSYRRFSSEEALVSSS